MDQHKVDPVTGQPRIAALEERDAILRQSLLHDQDPCRPRAHWATTSSYGVEQLACRHALVEFRLEGRARARSTPRDLSGLEPAQRMRPRPRASAGSTSRTPLDHRRPAPWSTARSAPAASHRLRPPPAQALEPDGREARTTAAASISAATSSAVKRPRKHDRCVAGGVVANLLRQRSVAGHDQAPVVRATASPKRPGAVPTPFSASRRPAKEHVVAG